MDLYLQPAHTEYELAKGLDLSEEKVWSASKRLITCKSIAKHGRVTKTVSENVPMGTSEYYPA